jgi:hypothetical protein
MSCDKFREMLIHECTGALDPASAKLLELHLASCDTCRDEREALRRLWTGLTEIPLKEPNPQMRQRFYALLDGYREGMEQPQRKSHKNFRFFKVLKPCLRPAFQLGIGVLLVLVGGIAGYWLRSDKNGHEAIADLRTELHETRQMLAVALLNQSSAGERLKGVIWSAQINSPDPEFLETLYHTLNADPNVNVRLSAMDALSRFSDKPDVRKKLVGSLAGQDSPLVQIMLIDTLVRLNERHSVKALQGVADDVDQNSQVRERAQWGLRQLL